MNNFIIGLISFPIMYLFDHLQFKNHPLKVYAGLIGFGGLIFAIIEMAMDNEKLAISPAFSLVGYLLFIPFVFLLYKSFFLEIPFNETYVKKEKEQKLVSTGAYSLTRHPGVIWLFFSILGLSLITRSWYLFLATFIYSLANCLYVYYQEKLFLLMIPGYYNYQQQVPMLIPNKKSINNYFTAGRKLL